MQPTGADVLVALVGVRGDAGKKNNTPTVGNRVGPWSFWLSANHLDSNSQPVSYGTLTRSTTAASVADPVVSGASPDRNRTGRDRKSVV